MTRSWKDNAHEFGALTKQGVDVRLALLVACSVEPGTRGGVNRRSAIDKATAATFASEALTTDHRVKRHLDAWDKAAESGWCAPSADLIPADAANPDLRTPTQEQFESVFDASQSGGRPRASVQEIAKSFIEQPEKRREVLQAIHEAEPEALDDLRDDALEARIGTESAQRRKQAVEHAEGVMREHHERQQMDNGPKWELEIRTLADMLARGDHWENLLRARDYLNGLLESHTASDLTPEMFQR